MGTDDRAAKSSCPQTITRDMAGKWIAWSEDSPQIVAVGDSFDDCERRAIEAGYAPNIVVVGGFPEGRGGRYRIIDMRWSMGRVLLRLLLVTVILVAFAVAFAVGIVLGLVVGESRERGYSFSREREVMGSMLKGDPAFAGVQIEMNSSDGSAYLGGEVETKEQYERLRSNVKRLFGESGEIDRMGGVAAKER